jgi:hypothetical protein
MDIPTFGYGKQLGEAVRSIWDPKAEAEGENLRTTSQYNQLRLTEAQAEAKRQEESRRLLADLISGPELQGPVVPGQSIVGRDEKQALFTPGENGFAVGINRDVAKQNVRRIIAHLVQKNPEKASEIMATWGRATLDGGVEGDFYTKLQAQLIRSLNETTQSVTSNSHIPVSPTQFASHKANVDAKLEIDRKVADANAERERIAREQEAVRAAGAVAGVGPGGGPLIPSGSRLAETLSGARTTGTAPDFKSIQKVEAPAAGQNVAKMDPAPAPQEPVVTPPADAPYDPIGFPGEPAPAPAAAPAPVEPPVAPITQAEAEGRNPSENGIAADLTGWTPVPGRPGMYKDAQGNIAYVPVSKQMTEYQKEQIRLREEALRQQALRAQSNSPDSLKVDQEQLVSGVRRAFNGGVMIGSTGDLTPTAATTMSPGLKSVLEIQWTKQFLKALDAGADSRRAYLYATEVMTDVVRRHYSKLDQKDYIRDSVGSGDHYGREVLLTDRNALDPDVVHAAGSEAMIEKPDVIPGSPADDDVEKGIVFNGKKVSMNDANRKMIMAAGIINAQRTNGYMRMPDKDGKPQQSIMVDRYMANEAQALFLELYGLLKASGGVIKPDLQKEYEELTKTRTPTLPR